MALSNSQWLANPDTGYDIEQSCRYNDGDSPYLNRSFGTPTSAATFGYSFWIKLGAGYNGSYIISADGSGNNDNFYFNSNKINIQEGGTPRLVSNQVFQDYGAWYHFVVAYELGNSTDAHKLRVYLNGSEITSWSTDARSGFSSTSSRLNANGVSHDIGANVNNGVSTHLNNFDGYIAEFHFVDGTVLTPSMFGKTNSSGVWVPIEASPTYGDNGFYLAFQDSSALGDDTSGEGNDWSSSGLAATDQLTDSPTNNFCTLSPIDEFGGGLTLSDGNLHAAPSASEYCNNHGTIYIDSGKWVFECKHTTIFGEACGFSPLQERISGSSDRGYFMFSDGRAYDNTTNTGTKGTSLANGDYRYVFLDMDNQAMWFAHVDVSSSNALVYDNSATKAEIEAGTTTNAVFTSIPAGFWAPGIWMDTSGVIEVNFGQSDFITSSTLPSGFKKLKTDNLSTPTILDGSAHCQADLYTSQTTGFSPTFDGNSNLAPDFLWFKRRDSASNHFLFDKVRGVNKGILSDATTVETTYTNSLTAFGTDGFTLGDGGSSNDINGVSGGTYVAWGWAAGNSTGSTNEDGSVDSTVTANTTAGFSICKFNPGGNSNVTFGHGLGVAPRFLMVKNLEDATNWQVLHLDQGVGNKLFLNTTAAAASDANMWQNTAPTSSVVSVGTAQTSNEQNIAYVWNEVAGYSRFRSYIGNGSADGPFIWTGFKPAVIIFKNISASSQSWEMFDNLRDGYNDGNRRLYPNATDAEPSASNRVRLTSNGFKIVTSGGTHVNGNGNTILYAAWAEHPFGGENVAPATAR